MAKNSGSLLDKLDLENAQSLSKQDLFGKDINVLRGKCFGKVIQRMHSENTTTLSGLVGNYTTDLAPFLYFYDSIILDICPGCPQATDPSILEPYLRRGLVTIRVRSNYRHYLPDFQELALRYQEYFIGPNSMVAFKLYRLNNSFPHDPKNNYCLQCSLKDKLEPLYDKLKKLGDTGKILGGHMSTILDTPVLVAEYAANLFIDTMKHLNSKTIRELETTVNLMSYLTTIHAFKSVPQFHARFLNFNEFFLKPLRINHDKDLELDYYLDFIEDFKGTLSPTITPKNNAVLLSKVRKINEEIDKIRSSKRRKIALFLSHFFPDVLTILTRIATQGTYGEEAVYQKALRGYNSPRLSMIKSKIFSKYYNVSKVGAQIWQIRETLDKTVLYNKKNQRSI